MENLIHQIFMLDAEVKAKNAKLKDMKKRLSALAVFPEGKKTAHLESPYYTVTVQKILNESWDGTVLNGPVRRALGDALFTKLFRWKFEAEKKELDSYLAYGPPEHYGLIVDARTIKEGSPQVRIELLESC